MGSSAVLSTTAAANEHPKTEHVNFKWFPGHGDYPGHVLRSLEPGPIAHVHVEDAGGYDEVCRENSRAYAEYIMNSHSVWERFNSVDEVESNMRWHYWAKYRDDGGIAGIQIWEQGNPMVSWSNTDGEEAVSDDEKYDSIAGDGTSIKDEWCNIYDC